jgi:hypothetical protein
MFEFEFDSAEKITETSVKGSSRTRRSIYYHLAS